MTSTVWYFAYGSNMQSATFRGRRGIEPLRALAARLPGWRLVFDKPPLIPIGESFANVVSDASAEVFGVLYEIVPADLEHVDLSEGVLIENYRRIPVRAGALANPEETLDAFTLTSDRHDPALQPSTRYMGLLIEGALEHRLPESYIAWLQSVPARPPSQAASEFRAFVQDLPKRRS